MVKTLKIYRKLDYSIKARCFSQSFFDFFGHECIYDLSFGVQFFKRELDQRMEFSKPSLILK